MNTALQAHFGGTSVPCFPGATDDLIHGQIVRFSAQGFVRLTLGESAEFTAEIADIRVIDVAVDHIADGIAVDLTTQGVCGLGDGVNLACACGEQADDLTFGKVVAVGGPF